MTGRSCLAALYYQPSGAAYHKCALKLEEIHVSTQPFDYSAIVADLEAKKAAIEATLTTLRSALAIGALGQPGDAPGAPNGGASSAPIYGGDVPDGAFHGKGIPEATKFYLEIVKKKQTASEIADALQKGGMESTSSDFLGVVKAGLNRARKLPLSPLVKLGAHWGLKSWYPKGIISGIAAPSKKPKKKQRKTAKAPDSKTSEPAAIKHPAVKPGWELTASGAKDKILEMLTINPHADFLARELAKEFGQDIRQTHLILANLVRARKIEKTGDGKYRVFRPSAEVLHAAAN
jgi:hypothetical protein